MTKPANRPSAAGSTQVNTSNKTRTTKTNPGASSPRRWPDLLIGLLVLLLLGGFGALLLGQNRPSTVATVPATSPTIPAAPNPVAEETVAAAPEPVTVPSADTPSATPSTAPATDSTAAPSSEPAADATSAANPVSGSSVSANPAASDQTEAPVIAATPIQPATGNAPTVTAPPVSDATQGQSTQTQSEAPAAVTPAAEGATTAATPSSAGAVRTSANRIPLRSDYRISLGVYSTAQTVRTQTAGVAGLGYTVYPINIGDQFVAQVGPFADEASAERALADIRRAYPGAVMYPPRNRTTSTTNAPTTPATNATTPNTIAPTATANGPTYLQVGAFDRQETAQRLVARLRELGYNPTVNAPEGRKVTVMVGPFSGDALGRTEARLTANGLDHFRVR